MNKNHHPSREKDILIPQHGMFCQAPFSFIKGLPPAARPSGKIPITPT